MGLSSLSTSTNGKGAIEILVVFIRHDFNCFSLVFSRLKVLEVFRASEEQNSVSLQGALENLSHKLAEKFKHARAWKVKENSLALHAAQAAGNKDCIMNI